MKKNRFLMKGVLVWALIFGTALTLASCGMSKEQVEKTVARMFQETLDTEYQRLWGKVDSVTLVKTAANENKYRGEIQATLAGGQYKLGVSAIADKDAVLYELEPDGAISLAAAIQRADDMKKDVQSKTGGAFREELNTNAAYVRLGVFIRSVQLAEAELNSYRGSVTVTSYNENYELAIAVTVDSGGVRYELSPEAVSTLDSLAKRWNDILAQGYSAYCGTWVGQRSNGSAITYTVSVEECKMSLRVWDIPVSLIMNPVKWELMNNNTENTDYNRFGYNLWGTWTENKYYTGGSPLQLYLHKTDSSKILIFDTVFTKR
jgi:hypothetical protein